MAGNEKEAKIVEAIRKSNATKVKVAVADIDGILRGKYLHKDKFLSAVDGGFGFCDVVLGWDSGDQCYDNTKVTGWQHGFPDALARLDISTHRNVPWDDGVDFFLGNFVTAKAYTSPVVQAYLRNGLLDIGKNGELIVKATGLPLGIAGTKSLLGVE